VAARFSFASKSADGYGTSLLDGIDASDEDTQIGRGTLLWSPSDSVEVLWSADWTHIREQARHAVSIAVNPNSFITVDQNAFAVANGLEPFDERWVYTDLYENHAEYHPGNSVDIWGTSLTATWQLSDSISLKSITAYRNLDSDAGMDFDGSPSAISDQSVDDDQDQWSQEILLNGTSFDSRLEWTSGAYYQEESGINTILLMLSFAENPFGYDTLTTNEYKNRSYALYSQATYHLTDALGLIAGLRYSDDKKDNTITTFATKFGVDLVPTTPASDSWDTTNYRVGLQYTFNDAMLGYLTNATGFKVGGFNGRAFSLGEFASYGPEKVNTTELGLKSEFADNRLRVNVAAYYSEYKDIQLTVNIPDPVTGAPLNVVQNAGRADISGVEIDGVALLGDRWEVDLGAAYTDAAYKSLAPGVSITLDDHLPLTPKWSGNLGLQFTQPMMQGRASFIARGDLQYQGDMYFNAQNSIYNFQEAYSLVNASIGVQGNNGKWDASLYGTNLTDKGYFQWMEDLLLFTMATGVVAPPREVGVEFTYNF